MKGRTYRFFQGEPLYPFGYGLSYTKFGYRKLVLPAKARAGQPVTVSVEVANTGKLAGEEVVQLYTKRPEAGAPIRELAGFQRVALRAGERKVVSFALNLKESVEISVGGKQPGFKGPADAATTEVLTGILRVTQ
jgi:beta-glucosidase